MTVEILDGKVVGYLTAEEYAERLGMTPSRIRTLIHRGKIDTIKIGWQHFIKEGTEIKYVRRDMM